MLSKVVCYCCCFKTKFASTNRSISGSLMSSNQLQARQSIAVNRFAGSKVKVPFSNLRASGDNFPAYLLSKVSGFEISGNFSPIKRGFLLNSSY